MLHHIFSLPFLFLGLKAQELIYIAVGRDGNVFTPSLTFGTVGDIVAFEWFNGTHNVLQMNDDGCSDFTVGGVTSGPPVSEPGKIFTFNLTMPGDFFYACQNHCELDNMKGIIVVEPPTPTTTLPTPTATATATTTGGAASFVTLPPYPGGYGASPSGYPNNPGEMYRFLQRLNLV